VVERRNQTIVGMARSMLKAKGVPATFWGEAVSTAVFILNRSPTKSLKGMTPFEAWHGRKPDVSFLRTFGCVGHVKETRPGLAKLADRSTQMVLLGYEAGSKAYRLYDPRARRVCISRDVVFDEKKAWRWAEHGDGEEARGSTVSSSFTIEHWVTREAEEQQAQDGAGAAAETEEHAAPAGTEESGSPTPGTPVGQASPATSASPSTASTIRFATPPPEVSDFVDDDYDGEPLRFRAVDNIIRHGAPPGLAERILDDQELHLGSAEEPTTFREAERDHRWRKAMIEEMSSIEENRTWVLVDPPANCRPIGLKWVFKEKHDERGNVVKHKARLVAKGYVQREGVDFEEVFAPVARMESVRLLLALAATEEWEVHHMDVKSAFLNGDLREEVYVQQPPGFVVAGEEHKVLRLRKALYGLRQAPRAWNIKLDESLVSLGFDKCVTEHALYIRKTKEGNLIVGVYVDDLIITGSGRRLIHEFKREMTALFKMSDLGLLSYYLGIEVGQTARSITLRQSAYAEKLLERSGMRGCKPCLSPMEEKLKLSKDSSAPRVNATSYRSIVGGLRYLAHTRPDISFVIGYLSRFMEDPREDHLAAIKRLLRYVAGTIEHGLVYPKRGGGRLELTGYSDSDMAGDVDGRRSTTGVVFFLGSCAISWQSQKQKVVALSTCEAEYIAAATACCQGIWLARLLKELTGEELRAPVLLVDNKSAIALAKNPVLHDRSKHIDTKFHFIRDCIEEGRIKVEYVETARQLGDLLTKPLGRLRLQELRNKVGVEEIKKEHHN
jgi:hypothetical protein